MFNVFKMFLKEKPVPVGEAVEHNPVEIEVETKEEGSGDGAEKE